MKTAIIVIGVIIVIIGGLYLLARNRLKNIPVVADHVNIITLTDKNFDYQLKNKVVLVDFWADWCAPCKMMAPVLNDVADSLTGNAHVGKIDVEKYQSIAAIYQIRNIPTMILFTNGKEVTRFIGMRNKEFLLKEIDKVR
jgi:thioredoxin 1